MKVLFCHTFPRVKELGAPKVLIELAEEMRLLGWHCDTVGPEELQAEYGSGGGDIPYSELLRRYLCQHAAEYDVVDYAHPYLPYPRSEFSLRTLFVARSVMLIHHVHAAPIPHTKRLLPNVKRLLNYSRSRAKSQAWMDGATYTIQQADLVNVCNHDEKSTLIGLGIPEEKIIVIPYGISRSRRAAFDAVSSKVPEHPVVAFVGTFDYRKGAAEFHQIVDTVAQRVPDVRFRLLGTKGLFQTKEEVFAQFPRRLRGYLEVLPTFQSEQLPNLLASCSMGVFPSYVEGCPFGVLEMLAASVPVIAYDVPGPTMMLPPKYLVQRGDAVAMGKQVAKLLTEPDELTSARLRAKQISQAFNWIDISLATDEAYTKAIAKSRQSMLTYKE